MARILIIEDDPDIVELVGLHLADLGHTFGHEADGASGLKLAVDETFDLVILDLMLPELDGLEVCKQLRAQKPGIPIMMLTSRTEEIDKVLGLELGADDYVTKPFSIRELVARIKALLRRAPSQTTSSDDAAMMAFGELVIDVQKRKVTQGEKRLHLTAKEFDLLAIFARNPGRAFSREKLLNDVWGYQYRGYEHTVNSHINRLRSKIEDDPANPRFIRTVWGVGYRFAEAEELADDADGGHGEAT